VHTKEGAEIQSKLINNECQEVSKARKEINVQLKPKEGKRGVELSIPAENFCYGKPTKPPTPIKDVMHNSYGGAAEAMSVTKYQLLSKLVFS
jgi:hypothetical protein